MIDFKFETVGVFYIKRENISPTELKLHFYGKDYRTDPNSYIKINTIRYKDLTLPELFEYTTMATDNHDYAHLTNVDFVSFTGTWHIKFTEDDVKQILKRKLS